jgi:hypothetical protein
MFCDGVFYMMILILLYCTLVREARGFLQQVCRPCSTSMTWVKHNDWSVFIWSSSGSDSIQYTGANTNTNMPLVLYRQRSLFTELAPASSPSCRVAEPAPSSNFQDSRQPTPDTFFLVLVLVFVLLHPSHFIASSFIHSQAFSP